MIISSNCICPFPSTPAIPRISPAWTSSETVLDAFSSNFTFSIDNIVSPASCFLRSKWKETSCPTISFASISTVTSFVAAWNTDFPALNTVSESDTAFVSFSLCVMKIIVFPCFLISLKISKSSNTSCGVNTAVGSSKIRISAPRYRVFKISTLCFIPIDKSATLASAFKSKWYLSDNSWTFFIASFLLILNFPGSFPITTFSHTVSASTNMKCWWTIPIAYLFAFLAECFLISLPFIFNSPSSALYKPNSTFINVVFPAPFSPNRQCISPFFTKKSIWSFAVKLPKRFVIFLISTAYIFATSIFYEKEDA